MIQQETVVQILVLNIFNAQELESWKQENCSLCECQVRFVDNNSINKNQDLVIVNSKLQLSNNWLRALQVGAYSYINVGTVSLIAERELCNNLEKKVFQKLSLQAWSELLLYCADDFLYDVQCNYFDCVYIKNELLEEIGIPNSICFSNINESQKWFKKASQNGWLHKLTLKALYFYDLKGKYSIESRLNYVAQEGLKRISSIMELYLSMRLNNERKGILHYLLADFQEGRKNNVGGTQFHVSDLVQYQKEKYNVFVLARDGEYLRLTEYTDSEKWEFDFYVGEVPENTAFFNSTHEKIYDLILNSLKVDWVHIHHTLGLPLNMFYSAKKRNIPVILSIHDYYYLCPVLKMLNEKYDLCTHESCKNECEKCLFDNRAILDGKAFMEKWEKEHVKVLQMCKKIVFPSDVTKETFAKKYPDITAKAITISHGIGQPAKKNITSYNHSKLRVAFIGGIGELKGSSIIYELITSNKTNFEWYIMGGIADINLYHLEQNNLTKIGWYKREEIYNLLQENEIDIVCILSIVSETFCYTLSEALAAGIPVIATDAGALGVRMKDQRYGWLVPRRVRAKELENLLKHISVSPSEYEEKKQNVISTKFKDIAEMGLDYDKVYKEVEEPVKTGIQKYNFYELYKYFHQKPQNNCDVALTKSNISEQSNVIYTAALERELNELKASPIIRLAIKIRTINFPGKKQMKGFVIKYLAWRYKRK